MFMFMASLSFCDWYAIDISFSVLYEHSTEHWRKEEVYTAVARRDRMAQSKTHEKKKKMHTVDYQ